MKPILLAAALLIATPATADVIMIQPNDGGGRIELTDVDVPSGVKTRVAECKGRLIAKTWSTNAADLYGCWVLDPSAMTIKVFWIGPDQHRTYDVRTFKPTKALERKYGG